jgi:two-component system osmolarity sensor histidine kinase EnvZ
MTDGPLKRFLPRGLLGRSILIVVTPVIMLQIVAMMVFYYGHWDTVTRRLTLTVAGDIAVAAELLQEAENPAKRAGLYRLFDSAMQLRIVYEEGAKFIPAPFPPSSLLIDSLKAAMEEQVGKPYSLDLTKEREVLVQVDLSSGVLHIAVPTKRLFSFTTYLFVIWLVGSTLILLVIAVLFMRNQVRSIKKLAAAADSLGKGRDETSIKPEGATEVRQAATAFMRMRDRLARQVAQRTEMLAGVSHDLKTPLTSMRLQLAMMPQSPEAEGLVADIADMERMIEGYLAFARGEGNEPVVPIDLALLAESVVERFRRNNASIDLHCEGAVKGQGRKDALRRCVNNLISNAVRYAQHVSVRVGKRGEMLEIVVDDDGPGIPEDKREDVFKPFLRLESSRNLKTGGTGLGLTITRDILRSHGGDVILETSPLGGLRAKMQLPG